MNGYETVRFLKEHGIHLLYHFTSKRNLESIQAHGCLMSWFELNERGISYIPSSNDFSRQRDLEFRLERYVRLSFEPHPRMFRAVSLEQRVSDLEVLIIPVELLAACHHIMFASDNACSHSAAVGEYPNIIPAEVIQGASHGSMDRLTPFAKQPELLVHGPLVLRPGMRVAA
jgi:hypothetical protein